MTAWLRSSGSLQGEAILFRVEDCFCPFSWYLSRYGTAGRTSTLRDTFLRRLPTEEKKSLKKIPPFSLKEIVVNLRKYHRLSAWLNYNIFPSLFPAFRYTSPHRLSILMFILQKHRKFPSRSLTISFFSLPEYLRSRSNQNKTKISPSYPHLHLQLPLRPWIWDFVSCAHHWRLGER